MELVVLNGDMMSSTNSSYQHREKEDLRYLAVETCLLLLIKLQHREKNGIPGIELLIIA